MRIIYKLLTYMLATVLCSTVLSSCKYFERGVEPVAQLYGESLYLDEIQAAMTEGLSSEDSLKSIDLYVRNWATDRLLYKRAEENLTDLEEIEQLVERYRRSLMIYEYQLQLVRQHLSTNISSAEIQSFYNNNIDLFISRETLFQGVIITVPKTSPAYYQITDLMKEDVLKMSDIDPICSSYTLTTNYFDDKWVPLMVGHKLGMSNITRNTTFGNKNYLEYKDKSNLYVLIAQDHIYDGEKQPIEYVSERISNTIVEHRKADFLRKMADDIYNEAVSDGTIKRNK